MQHWEDNMAFRTGNKHKCQKAQDIVVKTNIMLCTRAVYVNYNDIDLDWYWYWDLFAQDYSHDKLQQLGTP
jgi:hypothetical protein